MLEDPSGAVIGLWEPVERQGAQRVNEAGAWAMSVLHTPSRSVFYADAFGWEAEEFGPARDLPLVTRRWPRDAYVALCASEQTFTGRGVPSGGKVAAGKRCKVNAARQGCRAEPAPGTPRRRRGPKSYLSSAEDFPSSSREMISSWICWVPSNRSRILTSRAHFSSSSPSP